MKLKKKLSNPVEEVVEEKSEPKYSNLREIMDTERVFNIIYSGVEQESYFNILYDLGIRNFLMSFHYIQNRHLSLSTQYGGKGIKFFIDSGAHTYQNDPKYAEYDLEYWESHLQKYLRWAEKNKDYIFAIASFDFENIVGAEQVRKWNREYFEPFMLRTGIPVCFVWHQNSADTWEQYCERYPYVGFSSVNTEGVAIDFNEYANKLKVAEKFSSLVHGFGMTRTSMLTSLPFYTADSTTWLVGLQYGEINYWTGTKMSRLKKDKWKGSMLDTICETYSLDHEKMLEENVEELIKANIYAFIDAEKYVQSKLKSYMYWLRPKSVNRKESDLDKIKYPSAMWLDNAQHEPDWEDYARSFNISTEDKIQAINCIIDLTIFMNWEDEEYQPIIQDIYKPELISEIHDMWINRIVESDEDRVRDLKKFFTEVLLGENDKLLLLGTNFDRIVKERDSYISDEEYETVEVSELELGNTLSKYLPAPKEGSPAPEISDLDDEIFREEGIVPVRDANGRFLKGQKQVLKPKKLYSNKYPKMSCDACINAQRCPEYKAGYVCAYNKMFERYNTRDMVDVIQAMQGIVDFSLVRLQRGMMTETMNGGIPDPAVSNMMNQTMGLLTQLQRMYECGSQEVIRQTKVVRSDGTQETTTQVSNPQAGGVLSQIFGNLGASDREKEQKDEDIIDV